MAFVVDNFMFIAVKGFAVEGDARSGFLEDFCSIIISDQVHFPVDNCGNKMYAKVL